MAADKPTTPNALKLGVVDYSGSAVDVIRRLKYSNHSATADEALVRKNFDEFGQAMVEARLKFLDEMDAHAASLSDR